MSHPGFHGKIEANGEFPPEAGRYILYASVSCPFVHRTLISHALKGLDGVVKIVYVHPVQAHVGGNPAKRSWVFAGNSEDRPATLLAALEALEKKDESELDETIKKWMHDINPANTNQFGFDMTDPLGHRTAKELYEKADPTYDGVWTVPVLYDTKTKKIVNAESAEICEIFDSAFDAFAKNPEWSMYPAGSDAAHIKSTFEADFAKITAKGYGVVFAKNQVDHYLSIKALNAGLESLSKRLETSRFAAGDKFTEADIRLAVVLLRMDPVSLPLGGVEAFRIFTHFPVIHAYLRDVYQNVFNDQARKNWSAEQSCGAFWSYGKGIAPLPLDDVKQLQLPVDRSQIGK